MVLRLVASLFAFGVLLPAVATAAVVSPLSGEVRVSTGQGFQKIAAPTVVAAGGQVMVSPGGSATIAYAQDCVVPVKPFGLSVIQTEPPCRKFPPPSHFGFEEMAVTPGDAAGDTYGFAPKVSGEEKKTSSEEPAPVVSHPIQTSSESGDGSTHWGTLCLVGGVVVGAGALAAILLGQNNSKPVSP